jgi:hypothetical protein
MSIQLDDLRFIYDQFDSSIAALDCGKKCAPHNPSGKPFCCDICHAVPAVYHQEWDYLKRNTDLWHEWRGDECLEDQTDPAHLRAETPEHMRLLACKGPQYCQREYRALSCRQFPFFPYITTDYRFIGLAYEWTFEPVCWVINNLGEVSQAYRSEFVRTFDALLASSEKDLFSYSVLSGEMREHYASQRRRIPLLHRKGEYHLISPNSERMQRVAPEQLKRFGPYKAG